MVRPVQQIEQELQALDRSVSAIAIEFQDTYRQYLAVLGKAVRQQLILASYHLCTRGYPNQFLRLSVSQRQDLQQSLQRLAKQTQSQLQDQLQTVQAFAVSQRQIAEAKERARERARERERAKADAAAIAELKLNDPTEPETWDSVEQDPEAAIEDLEMNALEVLLQENASDSENASDFSQFPAQFTDLPINTFTNIESSSPELPVSPLPIFPKAIAQWQDDLERSIVQQLQSLSHAANRLLQQTKILPSRLPEPVLEVAAKADIAAETSASSPNLLSLLVESESDDETSVTQLLTIRLRLAEIEFSDASIGVWRSKIRSLMAQLSKLGREYQKCQTEKAIAQAETAWRSSWFEES
jgi:hypothetical protein